MPPTPLQSYPPSQRADFKVAQYRAYSSEDETSEPIVKTAVNRVRSDNNTGSKLEWPRIILLFERYVVPKYLDTVNREDPFPRKTGLLPHVVIAENNTAALDVLLKLNQLPQYKSIPKMTFSLVMRCAAYYGRLETLRYLHQELSKDPAWTWELDLMVNALKNPHPDIELLEWLCDHCPLEAVVLNSGDFEIQARLGNLDVIRYLDQRNYTIPASAMDTAAMYGHIQIVRFLNHYRAEGCSTNAMDGAASNGHLSVVRFLHEYRSEGCTAKAMDGAAEHGFLDVVKFLHKYRSEGCTTAAMDGAASNGHLEVVWFLHKYRTEGCTTRAMDKAAARGDIQMVKFLHEFRSEGCTSEAMDQSAVWDRYTSLVSCNPAHLELRGDRKALCYSWDGVDGDDFLAELHSRVGETDASDLKAQRNHLEVVEFLHENRTEGCSSNAMDEAARIGHLEVVKFLHENRAEGCTTDAMDDAAWRGHLEIVKFLHENRNEGCTTDAIDYAAREGHLEVVKFLHENRYEGCTTTAMDGAAAEGHLEVVKYLHKHRTEGCTIDAMDKAAKNGHLEVVRFLQKNRFEGCTANAMDDAAGAGHLEIIKFLDENFTSCCTTKAMDNAARSGHLGVVKYLSENRSEGCTTDAMDYACGEGDHIDIVQYLHKNRNEGCTSRALLLAVDRGNIDIVKFLHENRDEVDLYSKAARATVHSHHEFIEFVCQTVPDAIPNTLLNENALADDQSCLAVLCAYSTKGCLFEAKELALRHGRVEAVEVLETYLSEALDSCSLAQHTSDGPRRCQRVAVPASSPSWSNYSFDETDEPNFYGRSLTTRALEKQRMRMHSSTLPKDWF